MSAAEDRALCFRIAEHAKDTEITYCRAPIGTTLRVRLGAADAGRLIEDPGAWDWFQHAQPPVLRGHIHDSRITWFDSALASLVPAESSDRWRRLSVPPYGDVMWAPSPESYKSHIFVNGIRVVSLHRNFDRNVMTPQQQLRQPIISISDHAGSAELRLTRDGFVTYPTDVFSAVRRDALADHIAWLITIAQDGPQAPVRWRSALWEEDMHNSGQGDGVVHAVPYVATDRGIIPLHGTALRQAGITELDFLLIRSDGMTTRSESRSQRRGTGLSSHAARTAVGARPGHATGLLEVNMMGGFGYSPLVAGVDNAFFFASRFGTTDLSQVVTVERGQAYAHMRPDNLLHTWQDALALKSAGAHTTGAADLRIHTYLDTITAGGKSKKIGPQFDSILHAGCYGVLHGWLDDQPTAADEFTELWHTYRLPPVLPFGMNLASRFSPLHGDLAARIERVTAESQGPPIPWPPPGHSIRTPQWRPPT
ncbi:hypothetical protein [Streptacidiphilus sp. PAMC 29251]